MDKLIYRFPDRLRSRRKTLKLTRKGLEELSGIPVDTLTKWELGRTDASLCRVARLAEALGVTIDWLAGLTDDEQNATDE